MSIAVSESMFPGNIVGYAACPARPDLLAVSDVMMTFYPTVGEAICHHFRGVVRRFPGESRTYMGLVHE